VNAARRERHHHHHHHHYDMIIISFLVVGTRAVKISSSGDALSMSLFFLLRVVFFAQSDVGIFSCEKKN
jgi:hypothetical protein